MEITSCEWAVKNQDWGGENKTMQTNVSITSAYQIVNKKKKKSVARKKPCNHSLFPRRPRTSLTGESPLWNMSVVDNSEGKEAENNLWQMSYLLRRVCREGYCRQMPRAHSDFVYYNHYTLLFVLITYNSGIVIFQIKCSLHTYLFPVEWVSSKGHCSPQ